MTNLKTNKCCEKCPGGAGGHREPCLKIKSGGFCGCYTGQTKHKNECCSKCFHTEGGYCDAPMVYQCTCLKCPCHHTQTNQEESASPGETSSKLVDWRTNIHNTLKHFNYEWEHGLPLAVIDAIDAAYVAGLDENKQEIAAKYALELTNLEQQHTIKLAEAYRAGADDCYKRVQQEGGYRLGVKDGMKSIIEQIPEDSCSVDCYGECLKPFKASLLSKLPKE